MLASLNHANIAHLHGLEESGEVRALVMELVESEGLFVAHRPRRDSTQRLAAIAARYLLSSRARMLTSPPEPRRIALAAVVDSCADASPVRSVRAVDAGRRPLGADATAVVQ